MACIDVMIPPLPAGAGAAPLPLLADASILVSLWRPLLVLAAVCVWAWVVSSVYDKDAARWYFARQTWNLVHMAFGFAALAVVLAGNFGPISFLVTFPAMLVLLAADLLLYFFMRNADERVPEAVKWSLNPRTWFEMPTQAVKTKKKGKAETDLVIRGPSGPLPVPEKETPEHEVRLALEDILDKLVDMRGSQLDIGPARKDAYAVLVTVDGVRNRLDELSATHAGAVIDLVKRAADMDVSDRRRKQHGKIHIGKEGSTLMEVGLTTIGTSSGMRMTFKPDPVGQVTREIDELGLLPNQMEDLKSLIRDEGRGVVLQVAPPDSGRTTTFYTLLRQHDAYTSNVQTVEYEPEMMLEGARHNEFDPAVDGAEFSTTLRSILRRDPDVLGVSEMPDEATAKEVAGADLARTRIYLSFREQGALEAIHRYVSSVGDAKLAAEGLKGAIAQKLVRRLCTNCRVPFQPTEDVLKKLGLPGETKQLYRKSGRVLIKDKEQVCPVCNGTGYFGQLGIFAVHTIGPDERELIVAGDYKQLRGLFRQKKQQSVQTSGLQHVLAGDTSVDELLRVTASGKERKADGSSGGGSSDREAPSSQAPASAEA